MSQQLLLNLMSRSLIVRVGTPALTSRNMKEAEMEKVAEFIDIGMQIAVEIKDEMVKTGSVGKSGSVTTKVSNTDSNM